MDIKRICCTAYLLRLNQSQVLNYMHLKYGKNPANKVRDYFTALKQRETPKLAVEAIIDMFAKHLNAEDLLVRAFYCNISIKDVQPLTPHKYQKLAAEYRALRVLDYPQLPISEMIEYADAPNI